MKHLFIINPAAGKEDQTGDIAARIQAAVIGMPPEDCSVVVTQYPRHAGELVRFHAQVHRQLRVYACGGDGTLQEVAEGAHGLGHVAVTHYPCGSGNDFVRSFGEDARHFSDLFALVQGEVVELDAMRCNGRLSVNICSMGFDARVARDMAQFRRFPLLSGSGGYNLSLGLNLVRRVCSHYEVAIDGERLEGRMLLVLAANGRYYGGGFNPTPDAVMDDGLLDFLLVRAMSPFKMAAVIKTYAAGGYRELADIITWRRGRTMKVSCARPDAVNLDGEIITADAMDVSVVQDKLRFIVPQGLRLSSGQAGESRILMR